MREIRYRGIGIAERKWVFGSLWFDTRDGATLIWSEELKYWVRVDPATVGQYTGLKDEHGKEIYEGDVIRSPLSEDKTRPHRIFYHTGNAAFMGALVDRKELCYLRLDQDWIYKFGKEVIGNIHDNPELLKTNSHDTSDYYRHCYCDRRREHRHDFLHHPLGQNDQRRGRPFSKARCH